MPLRIVDEFFEFRDASFKLGSIVIVSRPINAVLWTVEMGARPAHRFGTVAPLKCMPISYK